MDYKAIATGFLVTGAVVSGVYIASGPEKEPIKIEAQEATEDIQLIQSEPLTLQEFRAYIDLITYELEKGPLTYTNITDFDDLINRLNDDLEARVVVEEEVVLRGEILTQEEYAALKGGILDKFN
jgi:hypothetical protein